MKFKKGALGGTFSLLHEGHRHLLKRALEYVDRLVVGISTDELVETLEKDHPVESMQERVERLAEFLAKEGALERCEIVPLDDRAGPAARDPEIECLIATDETLLSALEVNLLRMARALPPLSVVVVEPLLDSDGVPLSSTRLWRSRLRRGSGDTESQTTPAEIRFRS